MASAVSKGRGKRGRLPRTKEAVGDGGDSLMESVANAENLGLDSSKDVKEDSNCGENGQSDLGVENVLLDMPLAPGGVVNSNEISSESGLASTSEIFTDVPASFQFFVRAEEGIRLYVDLNSSPLNWVKRLNDEVSISQIARRDGSWSISNELKEEAIKCLEMSSEENLDTFESAGEPSRKRFDDNEDHNKSLLASVVEDRRAKFLGLLSEGNQPSLSCAITNSVRHFNDSGDFHHSVPVHASTQNIGKDSNLNDNYLFSGSLPNHSSHHHALSEVEQNLLDNPILEMNYLSQQNTETDALEKFVTYTSVTMDKDPIVCFEEVIQNSKDTEIYAENDLSGELTLEAKFAEKSITTQNKQPSDQSMSEFCTDTIMYDMDVRDDLPHELRRCNLSSSISGDVALVPNEEQFIKSHAEENVSSG